MQRRRMSRRPGGRSTGFRRQRDACRGFDRDQQAVANLRPRTGPAACRGSARPGQGGRRVHERLARAPINPSQMVYGEKTISGTYYGSVRPNIDFPILADLDLEKKINLDDLISRTYRFDEINEGFALMLAGEVARGVIVFD